MRPWSKTSSAADSGSGGSGSGGGGCDCAKRLLFVWMVATGRSEWIVDSGWVPAKKVRCDLISEWGDLLKAWAAATLGDGHAGQGGKHFHLYLHFPLHLHLLSSSLHTLARKGLFISVRLYILIVTLFYFESPIEPASS